MGTKCGTTAVVFNGIVTGLTASMMVVITELSTTVNKCVR